MRVIGTAGHVDHGKSTLVHALTGIDPDRLAEEKARGMTIDLGFAWLRLPGGQEASLVDVPGHERFIKNMLAGVGGIDVALLVVAADEGVMPQTREHLQILDLLGIRSGVVALTKRDLVDEEWLALVREEVEEELRGTSLAGAPIVAVSSLTGEGLDSLRAVLVEVLAASPARPAAGHPRLPIDRVFTVAGFGTVVTGTLVDGTLRVGDEVEVQPGGLRSRVRGLQAHKQRVEAARAGTRLAVNLAGLAVEELERGDVLTAPGWLQPTRLVDVRLRAVRDAERPIPHNIEVSFHSGAAETTARVALLEGDELAPGGAGLAQLRLARPLALVRGDLFIIRQPSPGRTIGGGEVLDAHPRRHRRTQPDVVPRLRRLEQGSPADLLLEHLRQREPVEVGTLLQRAGMPDGEGRAHLRDLIGGGKVVHLGPDPDSIVAGSVVASSEGWARLRQEVESTLRRYHHEQRLRRGMPREELRGRLGLEPRLFARVEARLVADGVMAEDGPYLRLPDHAPRFTIDEEARVRAAVAELRAAGATPPSRSEIEARHGLSPELTRAVVERGDLVEVGADLLYPADVYERMVAAVRAALDEQGQITVAQLRDRFGASRKYALALLEHLDQRKVTRRVGDVRVRY